jgi:hypothetical protein
MRLGIPGYLIHSTNKAYGVGMQVSHGCIRMYPEDIEKFFPIIKVGTPVTIVNQAVKVGWFKDALYIEVHPPLETHQADNLLDIALDLIEQNNAGVLPVLDGKALRNALIKLLVMQALQLRMLQQQQRLLIVLPILLLKQTKNVSLINNNILINNQSIATQLRNINS